MAAICLYFQVHQPYRIKPYSFFNIGNEPDYINEYLNRDILDTICNACYLPANIIIKDLLRITNGRFKVAFSISGTLLEQLEQYRPEVLDSFRELSDTGNVEFLGETYYHSLAFFYSTKEFNRQVALHKEAIQHFFQQNPLVFRNTELSYQNKLPKTLLKHGFEGIITEGTDWHLNGRNPNHVYKAAGSLPCALLLRNYRLSDDLAFRFGDTQWQRYPLTVRKYANSLAAQEGEVINLFMDYETFGEHHPAESGILDFLKSLPAHLLTRPGMDFILPSEAIWKYKPVGEINAPEAISWADTERDLSAWNGNNLQQTAIRRLYELEKPVKDTRDPQLLQTWRYLQSSDHFYYMSTKSASDSQVHAYFSPYGSPYDAYIFFMNVLSDLEIRIKKAKNF